MYTQRRLATAAVLISMTTAVVSAQSITSAHSGLVHYFEGAVTIDGNAVESKVGKFSEMKENSVLRTGQGRAEILLTPGVYLRVGENSAVKMLDNRLLSNRLEFLSGAAVVESDDPEVSVKDPAVTILYKDYQIQPVKYGIFEVTSDPSQMKVYKGQANVLAGGERTTVKDGKMVTFSAALVTEKFDDKQADDLYLWARDRSGALAAANMSSARSLSANGYSMNSLYNGAIYPGLGFSSGFTGGWYYNQYLGMYSYMPYGGTFYSPFGYGLYSPVTISSFYMPGGYYWYGGGGARTTSFVPQPIAGGVVRTGVGLRGAPGRITGGLHTAVGLPMAGTNSASLGAARGGFAPAASRSGGEFGSAFAGGRFGANNPSFNNGMNNSAVGRGSFGGGPVGGGSIGGGSVGGMSAGGGGAAGAHAGGVSGGGGRAR